MTSAGRKTIAAEQCEYRGTGQYSGFAEEDAASPNGIWLWAAADNLRIAAITAVECAESMIATRPREKFNERLVGRLLVLLCLHLPAPVADITRPAMRCNFRRTSKRSPFRRS